AGSIMPVSKPRVSSRCSRSTARPCNAGAKLCKPMIRSCCLRALAGRGAHRKLTVEIRSFVALRFAVLYAQSRRGYSQAIRGEIKQVFGVSLSGEALRPLFRQLKAELRKETTPPPPPTAAPEKRETACELPPALPGAGSTPASTALSPSAETSPALAPTRKQSPVLPASKSVRLCHHLGVLV